MHSVHTVVDLTYTGFISFESRQRVNAGQDLILNPHQENPFCTGPQREQQSHNNNN